MFRRKQPPVRRADYKEVRKVGEDVAGWPAFDFVTREPHLVWRVVTAPVRFLSRLVWKGFDVSP